MNLTRNSKFVISNLIRRAQSRNSLRIKVTFEICEHFRQFIGRSDFLKSFARAKNFRHLRKIIRVIRPQINFTAGRERGTGERRKMFVDEPVPAMFFLRPRVGEINVQRRCRMWREKILQKIR